jgi:hypothetical protein
MTRRKIADLLLAAVLLAGALVAIPVAATLRALRWVKSREADGVLFIIMLAVLAIVLAALLCSIVIARPATATEWFVINTSSRTCVRPAAQPADELKFMEARGAHPTLTADRNSAGEIITLFLSGLIHGGAPILLIFYPSLPLCEAALQSRLQAGKPVAPQEIQ